MKSRRADEACGMIDDVVTDLETQIEELEGDLADALKTIEKLEQQLEEAEAG